MLLEYICQRLTFSQEWDRQLRMNLCYNYRVSRDEVKTECVRFEYDPQPLPSETDPGGFLLQRETDNTYDLLLRSEGGTLYHLIELPPWRIPREMGDDYNNARKIRYLNAVANIRRRETGQNYAVQIDDKEYELIGTDINREDLITTIATDQRYQTKSCWKQTPWVRVAATPKPTEATLQSAREYCTAQLSEAFNVPEGPAEYMVLWLEHKSFPPWLQNNPASAASYGAGVLMGFCEEDLAPDLLSMPVNHCIYPGKTPTVSEH